MFSEEEHRRRLRTAPTLAQLKESLRKNRKEHEGMTVPAIAKATGLSERTIRRYADPSDPTRPDFHAVAVVAHYFGESLDHLIRSHLTERNRAHKDEVRALVGHLLVHMNEQQMQTFHDFLVEWAIPGTLAVKGRSARTMDYYAKDE